MSTVKKEAVVLEDPTGPRFQLYFDEFYSNPNGMLCIVGKEVVQDKTVLDKLTIMKPIWDMKDFDKKRYKARLSKHFNGVVITEPNIPNYFWKDPVEVQALVDCDEREVCAKTELTYKTMKMHLKEHQEHITRDTLFLFPAGVTCSNEHFNKKNRGTTHLLDVDVFMKDVVIGKGSDGQNLVQYSPFVVWKMSINGENKRTDDDDDGISGASKAFARLGITLGTRRNNDFDDNTMGDDD
jgi:hypothetical protein